MPEFTKTPAGQFCWLEHVSDDQTKARAFYAEVFGWKWAEQAPMSGGIPYAMGQIDGKNVAGVTALSAEAKKMNAPPHWLSYIATDDAAATAAAAAKLNAKTLMPVQDVGPGIMALLADPTGAVTALWQQKQQMGSWLYAENNALCWNELITPNVDIAGGYYSKLFGWKSDSMPMPEGQYTVFKQGEKMTGGMMATPKQMPGMPAMWGVYFQVKNTDAIVTAATRLGATVIVPANDAPNVGRFAMLKDPTGAAFGVLQPPQR